MPPIESTIKFAAEDISFVTFTNKFAVSVLYSDLSDPNDINKKFVPVNSIEDLNQFENPVVKNKRMTNYSGRNINCSPHPFERKSNAVSVGGVDKGKDLKLPSDKKLCDFAVAVDSVQPVK